MLSPERELDEAIELAARHDPRVIVEADGGGREVECSVIGNDGARAPRCRARSSPRPTGTTTRPSTRRAAWSWSCPAPIGDEASRAGPRAGGAGVQGDRRQRASPAATSSSATTARCSSTSSTRSPASPDQRVREALRGDGIAYPELCDRLVTRAVERHERERDATASRLLSAARRSLISSVVAARVGRTGGSLVIQIR